MLYDPITIYSTINKMPLSSKRGKGHSDLELDFMLENIQEVLPISSMEWDEVATRHQQNFPEQDRDGAKLKSKFASLYLNKIPTGDPKCPKHVRTAKQINILIVQKADLGGGSDDDELSNDDPSAALPAPVADEEGTGSLAGPSVAAASVDGVIPASPPKRRTPSSSRKRKGSDDFNIKDMMMMQMQQRHEDRQDDRERRRRQEDLEQQRLQQSNQQFNLMMMMMMGKTTGLPNAPLPNNFLPSSGSAPMSADSTPAATPTRRSPRHSKKLKPTSDDEDEDN